MANPETTDTLATEAPTPIWISRRTLHVLVGAAMAAVVLLLWRAPTLAALLIGGGALALVFSFPVRAFSRWMPRTAAIALSMLLAVALVVVIIKVALPIVIDQLRALVAAVPRIVQQLDERLPAMLDWLAARGLSPDSPEQVLQDIQQRVLVAVQEFMGRVLGSLGKFVSGVAGVAAALLGMVVVAVFLLTNARRLMAALLRATAHRYRRDVRALWEAFGHTLSRYLGGLMVTGLTEGLLAAIALAALDVPYAFLLGAWVSVMALIPYVGAWLGYAPALLLALSISPTRALLTLVLCVLINLLVGNVLAPRIHGQAVRLHPSLVFVGTIMGGELFGLPGLILAVPAMAMMRVLFDFLRVRVRVVEEDDLTSGQPVAEPGADGRHARVVAVSDGMRHDLLLEADRRG